MKRANGVGPMFAHVDPSLMHRQMQVQSTPSGLVLAVRACVRAPSLGARLLLLLLLLLLIFENPCWWNRDGGGGVSSSRAWLCDGARSCTSMPSWPRTFALSVPRSVYFWSALEANAKRPGERGWVQGRRGW